MKSEVKLMNLHNHTIWSDGMHSVEEIIEHAIDQGISKVGISDHYETYKLCEEEYLKKEEVETYISELREIKEIYKEQIEVCIGLEICMSRNYCEVDNLPYDLLNQLDFVLVEYVEDESWGDVVKLDELEHYIRPLHIPVGLAHTNLIPLTYRYGTEELIKKMKKLGIFWELNVSNRYTYAVDFLDDQEEDEIEEIITLMKAQGIQITVGTDTHDLKRDYNHQEVIRAHQFLEKYYHSV